MECPFSNSACAFLILVWFFIFKMRFEELFFAEIFLIYFNSVIFVLVNFYPFCLNTDCFTSIHFYDFTIDATCFITCKEG